MGLQVMIVDDSATMRSILRKVVSLAGYEVSRYFEGTNGQEGLDILGQQWVDLILLDVHMPVMDGLTMLRQMQQEELYSRIPVVLVTTEARQESLDEAKELGVKAHVKKPFQPEQIREVLDNILGDEYVRADEPDDAEGCDF